MNFRFTTLKTIVSIVLGLVPVIIFFLNILFGGDINLLSLLIAWLVFSGIIYSIWSLFQKKPSKKESKKEKNKEE